MRINSARFLMFCGFNLSSSSEITVTLKGSVPKCFGEELANNELLVLKADLNAPPGALVNLYVYSGLAEVGDINTKKVEKKNILFQELKKMQIGTALTSSSVISFLSYTSSLGWSSLDMR